MGYSEKDSSVRIDRFKDTGKWYDTFAVDMEPFWDTITPVDGVRQAIIADSRWSEEYFEQWIREGGSFVCVEPYHKYSYPVLLKKRPN